MGASCSVASAGVLASPMVGGGVWGMLVEGMGEREEAVGVCGEAAESVAVSCSSSCSSSNHSSSSSSGARGSRLNLSLSSVTPSIISPVSELHMRRNMHA